MFFIRKFRILAVLLAVVAVLSSCKAPHQEMISTKETFVMDTIATQTVYGNDGESVTAETAELLQRIESTYSAYSKDSITAKINQNAGIAPVFVEEEQFLIIKRCQGFSEQSNGLFDFTISPLVKLWNITGDHPTVPSEEEIAKARALIDYKDVVIEEENRSVFLSRPGMQIEFGATIKGYAVQKALELYKESNIKGGVLSLGGNVAAFGTKPDGSPFRIGLRDPKKSASDYFAILEITDQIIATSGGYERYFEQDGSVYHHILNPKTGYPCDSDLLSVTVISEDGLLCDYLSTLFYMQGKQAVISHLEEEAYALIAIDLDGKVYLSPKIAAQFTLLEESPYVLAQWEAGEE